MRKILTWLFNIYFVIFYGCCHNCINCNICSDMAIPPCSMMDDSDYPNYYCLDKHDLFYKCKLNIFLDRFYRKRHNKKVNVDKQ